MTCASTFYPSTNVAASILQSPIYCEFFSEETNTIFLTSQFPTATLEKLLLSKKEKKHLLPRC
jgi:hypothetical protein